MRILKLDETSQPERCREIAQLPCRMGGSGLRSCVRISHAAYWASWADVIPTLADRFPILSAAYVSELESESSSTSVRSCFRGARVARLLLQCEGFEAPTFSDIAHGIRPEAVAACDVDPGEFQHGWQYYAASARERHFRQEFRNTADSVQQTLLRSQSGRFSARAFMAVPSDDMLSLCSGQPLSRCFM